MARLALVPLAAMALLAACAGHKDPAEYARMTDDALCAAYGGDNAGAKDIVRAEIDRRRLVPAGDWAQIERGGAAYGMHQCSVLAALHQPETMVGGGRGIEIWTFPNDRVVRFQNGAVTAITEFR